MISTLAGSMGMAVTDAAFWIDGHALFIDSGWFAV